MSNVPGSCVKATKPFRTEAEFSLYSTDSENQVASVHQGLDRCAALLKSLLSPERNSLQQNAQELPHQAVTRRTAVKPSFRAPMKLLKGVAASSAPHRGKICPAGSTKPSVDVKFPGALKYLHPTSTPIVKHSRSKTEPRSIVASQLLKEQQPNPTSAHSGSSGRTQHQGTKSSRHKPARKYITAHRRLRTEPGGRNTQESGTQTEGLPPSQSIRPRSDTNRVVFQKNQHPQTSKQSTGSGIAPGITASVNPGATQSRQPGVIPSHMQVPLHGSYQPHTTAFSRHYPYPCYPPPAPFPSYTMYHPTYTGQYGSTICNPHPFPTSISPRQTEGCSMWHNPLQSSSLPHLPQCATTVQQSLASKYPPHLKFEQGKKSIGKRTSSPVSIDGPAIGASYTGGRPVSTTQPKSSQSTDLHSQPVQHSVRAPNTADLKTNRFHPSKLSPAASASQEIQLLIREMLNTFRHTIEKIKGTAATANSDLFKQLESLEHSLMCYLEQIADLCQHLLNSSRSSWVTDHSIADWLGQVQQLEQEKTHLLERVIKSEMAYSETQGLLDQTKTKLENLQDDLESQKTQVSTVIQEMQSNREAVTSLKTQKKAFEEELEAMKAENAVLQQQISHLEQEASKTAEETRLQQDKLSTTKCSLDTAQEEIQMVKLSLSEKETELLQAQDQLLGLRQCVVYFFSELVKVDPSRDSSCCTACYYVSEEAGQRLQGLVNNGSVDSFLAAYVNRTSTPVSAKDSPQESFDRTPQTQTENPHSDQIPTFPSQLNTHQAANDSNHTCNSLPGDQETESSGSTISQLLRAPKLSSSEHDRHGTYHPTGSYVLKSATSNQSNVDDVRSTLTTSSELEFRQDLASLDADIARLQMQFRVAIHNAPHVH